MIDHETALRAARIDALGHDPFAAIDRYTEDQLAAFAQAFHSTSGRVEIRLDLDRDDVPAILAAVEAGARLREGNVLDLREAKAPHQWTADLAAWATAYRRERGWEPRRPRLAGDPR